MMQLQGVPSTTKSGTQPAPPSTPSKSWPSSGPSSSRCRMSEIERLLQQQLSALQQQRQNEINGLEQQLKALLQQQELQQQILNSLNMTVVEQTQRCDVLHSAVNEQARCLQNLETVLMGALDSSGSL